MRLNEEMKIEFNCIKERVKRVIWKGDYLDKSYGNLGKPNERNSLKKFFQRISALIDPDMKIFMGPLQIQEQGC